MADPEISNDKTTIFSKKRKSLLLMRPMQEH